MEEQLVLSDNNRMLINELTKFIMGIDLEEQMQKMEAQTKALQEQTKALQEKDEALQEKDEALQEKDEALQEKDKAIKIMHHYYSKKMTDINELAAFFNVDVDFVKNVLENK